MDLKSSVNAFSSPRVKMGKDRKRLYSWSRPSKHLTRRTNYDSEMKISGAATLAFTADLKWFQGNIINEVQEVYTIRGRLVSESAFETIEEETEADAAHETILTGSTLNIDHNQSPSSEVK